MIFLLRRILHGLLLLFGVSVLSFAFFELAPGDFLEDLKVNPQVGSETVQQLRNRHLLDRPAAERYIYWAAAAAHGDLGYSLAYSMPVSSLVWDRAGATLRLSAAALLICWGLAVPLGFWCAAWPGGWVNRLAGAVASVLVSLPDLLLALLFLWTVIYTGAGPVSGKLIPAAVALSCVSFPTVFRHARASAAEALRMPFVDHLRACGIAERRIVFRHAPRAALNPLISLFGLSLGSMMGSSLVVEVVLGWPGMGPLLLESILARDAPVVLASVLLSSLFLVCGNLAADWLLYAADPRIREWGQ